ncbi:16S rRNA (adenine(1518)-N(6)/adenine(1519)-N(6))-dimethyltransferase RsmA [Zooshikella marina]|uniref:16S rRNA (adenine(1518)-N(6)/adenine(1519)-N(6))- dimethyltransferase RsmA n=1 Tax=Zooshikella ganghwensis TaxID=202772 RepID=UPI001BB0CCA9|nr:16S rRNA (adenine(1518)-N(6)/adenine(1519)-N(6))-dimethyltransferase RsmA [Zooshikella ganghwensis]MBU2708028.1 16S rRNA (adenine(1518)-N(6)/adenine(1519)-N(6))-dimethyltransferase RsmA [Zooshikella ganghwensis]
MAKTPNYVHKPRKRFGQNFLHDDQIIQRIVRAINPKLNDHLVEIGPGQGALTQYLVPQCAQIDVIELDRDLIPMLQAMFSQHLHFSVHQGDALKLDFSQLKKEHPLRVVGNLPYNISTPLLFHLFNFRHLISDMHFMLQKEVVERLAANPGENAYGRLSVMAQYFCKIDNLFIVKPGAFKPAPKVDSAIVRLIPHQSLPYPANDLHLFERVVRSAFNMRRKTLRNALKGMISAEVLTTLGINPSIRAEKLSLAEFVAIANAIESQQSIKLAEDSNSPQDN